MKTIKLFAYAFAALSLAAGCSKVQEGIETVTPGKAGTVITAGLENTRTELQSDGKKVYWQDGDVIAINGTASEALSISSPAQSSRIITTILISQIPILSSTATI